MSLRFSKMVQLLGRPQLIEARAAAAYARRLIDLDPRAFERPSGFAAIVRKMGIGLGKPAAWDDDDDRPSRALPKATMYAPLWMGEPDKQLDWGWSVKDGVAMMEIAGPLVEKGGWVGECGEFMHGYDTIAAAIAQADADPAVKGMLIRFDTPGGVVASGIYDLATSMQARDANAKPIWAHCEMACSAGYWIASQCDRVVAPAAGMVGSIGVVIVHENYAAALKDMGIEITSIEFPEGAFKTDGAWWKAMSEEGKAALQSDINELGAAFLATVEKGRGGKLSAGQAKAFGAQVYPAVHSDKARDASALGLIDSVMSEQQAFEALRAEVSAPVASIIPAPAGSPAASAASSTETTMSRKTRIDAVLAGKTSAKTDAEKLEEIRKITNEEDEPAAEGEDGETDEEDTDQPAAEGEDGEDAGEEDDASASTASRRPAATTSAKKPGAATVLAILDLPEAKGREAQARKLAETPGMTADTAKGILAAGPKVSRLSDKVQDVTVTGGGGAGVSAEEKERAADFARAGVKRRER